MRVVAADAVDPVVRGERDDVCGVERPQAGQVEDRAEIDVEGIVTLAYEGLDPAGQLLDGGAHERAVVRVRARPDVDRGGLQIATEDRGLVLGDPGDLVRLRPVEVRVVERRDRSGVVQERVAVSSLGLELEPIGHVLAAVAVVVHLHLVAHVVGELVEVRAAGGLFEGDVVGDERHGVGPIGTHERVHVRVVRGRVLADDGRLAMARRHAVFGARAAHERSGEHRSEERPDERDVSHVPLLRGGLNAPYSAGVGRSVRIRTPNRSCAGAEYRSWLPC